MKPKLLLNPGTGWSGTTPFYYTLRNAHFCHAGYKKEFHYLQLMHSNSDQFRKFMIERYTQPEPDFRTGELPVETRDYDVKYYQTLFEGEHSFDKYVDHMHYIKEKFPRFDAVCDFSNYNVNLPKDFLSAHAKAIHPHFDVKVTMLISDPIHRFYNELGGQINQYHFSERKRTKMKMFGKNEDMVYNHYVRTKQQQKLYLYCIDRLRFSNNCYYEKNYEKLTSSYGKNRVLVLQMEKLWDSSYHNEIIDGLSQFLDYQVSPSDLYPNQYVSENKNIEGLGDQNTEFEPLTEELYELGKKHL